MENLAKSKIDALLAFYNLFSEKLSLEECKSLLDARYLLHSIVNFIETHNLSYKDHSNFGYKETVNYLKTVLDESITSQLDFKLADENEDCFEIAKILVALFYELRLSKTKDVIEYVEELKPKYNSEIALIINHLDNSNCWSDLPDSWASILKIQQNFSNNNNTLDSTLDNTSPLSTPKVSVDCRRTTNVLNAIKTVPLSKNNSSTKSESSDRNCFQGSPVSFVINSPRGTELTKLKQLARQIAEMKEHLKSIGLERDNFEEMTDQLQNKLNDANQIINQLERKNNGLRQKAERIKYVQKELTDSEKEKYDLKMKVEELKIENFELSNLRGQLRCEKESATNRSEFLTKENESLKALLDSLNQKRRDEMEIYNFTRENLSKSENQLLLAESQWRKKINDVQIELNSQEKNFTSRLEEKENEIRQHIELSTEVQCNYLTQISQLESNLKESNAKLQEFGKVKSELDTTKTALSSMEKEQELLRNKLESVESQLLNSNNKYKLLEDEIKELKRNYTLNEIELKNVNNAYSLLRTEHFTVKEALVEARDRNVQLEFVIDEKNNELLDESYRLIEELKNEKDALKKENKNIKDKMECSGVWERYNDGFIMPHISKIAHKYGNSSVDDEVNGGRLSFYSAVSVLDEDGRNSIESPASSSYISACSTDILQEQEYVPLFQQTVFFSNSPLKDSRLVECSPIKTHYQYPSSVTSSRRRSASRCCLQIADSNSEQIDWSESSVKSEL